MINRSTHRAKALKVLVKTTYFTIVNEQYNGMLSVGAYIFSPITEMLAPISAVNRDKKIVNTFP